MKLSTYLPKSNSKLSLQAISTLLLSVLCEFTIVSAAEKLTLVTEIYPPYQSQATNSAQVQGMRTDTVREILGQTDIEYNIKVMPWARSYKAALNTPNTCIFSTMRLPFRENDFHWTIPLGNVSSIVYVAHNRINEYNIKKLSDLQRYLTVVHREDVIEQLLRRLGYQEGKQLFVVNGWKQAIDIVVKSRADIIVGNDLILAYYMKEAKLSPRYLVPLFAIPQLTNMQHYLACNKKTSPELLKKLQIGYERAESLGLIKQIIDDWRQKLEVVVTSLNNVSDK